MVRHLLNMHEALSSNPSNARNNQPLKVNSRGEILHGGLKSKLGVWGRGNWGVGEGQWGCGGGAAATVSGQM